MKRPLFLSALLIFITLSLYGNVHLPKIFSNNMVLQREQTIPVWGWADPKEKITVVFNSQTKKITADVSGKWRIDLSPEKAGGPFTLTVKGKNTIVISNILVGEVWVCSGQSNMEMPIGNWGFVNNYQKEISEANYPEIRQFLVQRNTATNPVTDVAGGDWKVCNPDNAAAFSAVAYFFGRELYQKLHVPIGLINTSWGGTQIESWISRSSFEKSDEFKSMIEKLQIKDLDKLVKQKEDSLINKIKTIQGTLAPPVNEISQWKDTGYNDAAWHSMIVPGYWEQQDLPDFDGVVWFRKTIILNADEANKPATLSLAQIDDNDETYLNGEKIGSSTGYNSERNYTIPLGKLKAGKNVIAVRITDNGDNGGFWGQAENVKLTVDGKVHTLAGHWPYRIEKMFPFSNSYDPNSYPTILYNGMINPLIPYAFKGAIWYQGETNAGRAYQYRIALPLLINDWRTSWKQGDFPFYFVQLASWNANNGTSETGSSWAELREAQNLALSVPNTGMAVTTDIGDAKNIHPKNKQDVGKRLAAIALNKTYGLNTPYSGPVYKSFNVDGNKIIVTFSNIGSGMYAKDKYDYLKGFEIAGEDHKFHYAHAYVDSDKVVVISSTVAKPVAVRYGWADDASDDNLYNREGFPAAPFRTDNWKGITDTVKFKLDK